MSRRRTSPPSITDSRPGRSVTSSRPWPIGCTSHGWSNPVAIRLTRRRGAACCEPLPVPSEGGVDDDGSASGVAEVWPEEVACAVWVGADSGSLAEEHAAPGMITRASTAASSRVMGSKYAATSLGPAHGSTSVMPGPPCVSIAASAAPASSSPIRRATRRSGASAPDATRSSIAG